jgi:hypothetical protein
MTDIKLLPCPFCGKPPEITEFGIAIGIYCANDDCDVGAETTGIGVISASEQWNRRAVLTAGREIDPLRRALRKLVIAARTSGGVAGRDDGLCAACDEAERVLTAGKRE